MKLNIVDTSYLKIFIFGLFLRIFYLINKVGDITKLNLGGDPCHHYNIALNISNFIGPKTNFIFSYWHQHERLPALTDVYLPGFHFFSAIFLFFFESALTTRFINILVYVINFLLIILISNRINEKKIGYLVCLFISLNFFHIENSVVFMTVNFSCLLVTLFFYLILLSKTNYKFNFWIGLLISYCSITFGGWQIILIISIIGIFLYSSNIFKSFICLIFGFLPIYIIWYYYSKDYFGIPFYSNLSFYPFVEDWASMMHSNLKPDILFFIENIQLSDYILLHLKWGSINLIKFSFILFPSFIFIFGFLTVPSILYSSIKLNSFGIMMLIFIIGYLGGMFFASYGMKGILWPRHYMILLFPVSFLIAYFFLNFFNSISFYFYRYFDISLFFSSLLILFMIAAKSSFWSNNTKPFYQLGEYIKKNDIDNILYGLTVQDLWCSSKKNIIMDPVFQLSFDANRAIEEINNYNAEYLLIDLSNHIYHRSNNDIEEVMNYYYSEELNFNLIYKDELNQYYLYEILK